MSDQKTRDELLELLARCNPRTRKTVMRAIEGKVGQDGVAFIQEQLSVVEPDMTVRSVDFISSRTCDFGHLQDQQTRILGVCQVCGQHTCSTQGCSFTCLRCGRSLCRRHIHLYADGEAYCGNCRYVKWFRLFFRLPRREPKK